MFLNEENSRGFSKLPDKMGMDLKKLHTGII